VSIRVIQDTCLKKLELPSRKMSKKPLRTDHMRLKRLKFVQQYQDWDVKK
jgi:hypothetical protein